MITETFINENILASQIAPKFISNIFNVQNSIISKFFGSSRHPWSWDDELMFNLGRMVESNWDILENIANSDLGPNEPRYHMTNYKNTPPPVKHQFDAIVNEYNNGRFGLYFKCHIVPYRNVTFMFITDHDDNIVHHIYLCTDNDKSIKVIYLSSLGASGKNR